MTLGDQSVSPLEELFERVCAALEARAADVDEVAMYRREWECLVKPREWPDEVREAGEWRIRLSRRGLPSTWAYVQLEARDGRLFYTGLIRERDLAMETVVQIERARDYNRDEREVKR